MATTHDGGPVLPEVQKVKRPGSTKHRLQRIPGMRLRDYFAAQAMQSVFGSSDMVGDDQHIATVSYAMADAMLSVRDQSFAPTPSNTQQKLASALRDCVSVMERELNGLAVIQPELHAARAALIAAGA